MRPQPLLLWAMLVPCACGSALAPDTPSHTAAKNSTVNAPPKEKLQEEAPPSPSPWDALVEPQRLSGPVVLVSETTGVESRDTRLKLTSDGSVEAQFEVVISNRAEGDAKVPIGFAWKVPGGQCADPPASLVDASGVSIPWIRKDTKSPPSHAAVFCVSVFYAEPVISGGSSRTFRTGMVLRSVRQRGTTTVLGFEDRFRFNLKNYSWSHVSGGGSQQDASALEEAFGSFFSRNDTHKSAFSITCAENLGACLRGVGFDGGGDGTCAVLVLDEATGATPISFSWSLKPNDLDDEISILKKRLARHAEDLRLRARLWTLLRIKNTGTGKLLAQCIDLLEDWTADRAEGQLLVGRNDHLFAVYGRCLEVARAGGKQYAKKAQRLEKGARGYIAKRKEDAQESLSQVWLSRLLDEKAP